MLHIQHTPVLRILSIVCIVVVLNITAGCAVYHLEPRLAEEAPLLRPGSIKEAVLRSGETVQFDEYQGGCYDIETRCIVSCDTSGSMKSVSAANVLYLRVETIDRPGTTLITFAILVGVVVSGLIVVSLWGAQLQ